MRKYRIKKETYSDLTKYYPQVKVLWWWHYLFFWNGYYDGFYSLETAQKALCSHIKRPAVEIIEFDPNEDCKK